MEEEKVESFQVWGQMGATFMDSQLQIWMLIQCKGMLR